MSNLIMLMVLHSLKKSARQRLKDNYNVHVLSIIII